MGKEHGQRSCVAKHAVNEKFGPTGADAVEMGSEREGKVALNTDECATVHPFQRHRVVGNQSTLNKEVIRGGDTFFSGQPTSCFRALYFKIGAFIERARLDSNG